MSQQLFRKGFRSLVKGVNPIARKTKRSSNTILLQTGQGPNPSSVTLFRSVEQVFPDILRVKIKNDITLAWTGAAGATNAFVITGNGLHNSISGGILSGAFPLATGAPSAIYSIPQITAIYNGYRIRCTRLMTQTQNTSAAVNDSSQLVMFPCTQSFIAGLPNINALALNTVREYPFTNVAFISGQTINSGVSTERCMHIKKIFGQRYDSTMEDSSYSGALGSNPPNVWYWVMVWFPTTNNNTTGATQIRVEYEIEWFSRNVLTTGSV